MKTLLPLLVVIIGTAAYQYGPDKLLTLTIYYESLCPACHDMILKQLRPAVKLLSSHLMLRAVPFGNAHSINNGVGGFECQHGPAECRGNIIQDCTLNAMLGRSNIDKVEYMACEAATNAATHGDMQCVRRANVSVHQVEYCLQSGQGTNFQLDSEHFTKIARIEFVPTITIDGVFNENIQKSAEVDMIGTLCSILGEVQECSHYYNRLAFRSILNRQPLRLGNLL